MKPSFAPRAGAATLLLCLASVPIGARALGPDEFARGLELSVAPARPIQRITLSAEVLATLVDERFGDACVFDAEGRPLPQAVSVPRELPELVETAVPLFPLETRAQGVTGGVVSVERNAAGTITRAFSRPLVEADSRVFGYLLDRSGEARDPVEALTLGLVAPTAFSVQVKVEASDDLDRFEHVATATVARLEHDGRTLRRDVLELPPTRARYLRLIFRDPPRDLVLTDVSARVRRPVAPAARHAIDLTPEPVGDGEPQRFQYTLAGAFSPDRYRVLLPPGTALIEATLFGSEHEDGPFAPLDRALFRRGDAAPRALPVTRDRYFRLAVEQKGGGVQGGLPKLQLGYLPPHLLFHVDGPGPYLLAYGSARARCHHFDEIELRSLAPDAPLPTRDTAEVLRSRELSGEAARTVSPAPRSLRVYVLWGVLIVAVAALGLVARRLLRSV